MRDNPPPGYELADRLALTTPEQVRALGNPLRTTVLQLLLERAATVTELATALGRPKSTVAHHVKVLAEAGLLQVVSTRRVRAVEERFYGRTARLFYVPAAVAAGGAAGRGGGTDFNDFEVAARESAPAFEEGRLWGFVRHARISEQQAGEFWERMAALVREFEELPREGDTVYGFAVGVYPTDHPRLPEAHERRGRRAAPGAATVE
ncbi:winged helix-turn-helix domain-containing protein [Nocardioides nanhaiensis]|uniref:winged helix-turn-helix domain-containing protein n=1 Tax=Nocardioides nanhaiensis TaxID=1476871 RepID=UPI0031EAB397